MMVMEVVGMEEGMVEGMRMMKMDVGKVEEMVGG